MPKKVFDKPKVNAQDQDIKIDMEINMIVLENTKETEVLIEAAFALAKHEKLRKELRDSENHLRKLCRQYDDAAGTRGFAPHHLAQACKARGLMV